MTWSHYNLHREASCVARRVGSQQEGMQLPSPHPTGSGDLRRRRLGSRRHGGEGGLRASVVRTAGAGRRPPGSTQPAACQGVLSPTCAECPLSFCLLRMPWGRSWSARTVVAERGLTRVLSREPSMPGWFPFCPRSLGCLTPGAAAPRGRGAGHPGAPRRQFQGSRAESDDSP